MAVDSRTHLKRGTKTQTYYVAVPSTDLRIGSSMGTQALYGQRFDVIETKDGMCRGALRSILPSSQRIDYIGCIPLSALSKSLLAPSHRTTTVMAAIFDCADIKSPLIGYLPRNACVEGAMTDAFLKVSQGGFIHACHVQTLSEKPKRPFTAFAEDMLGLPYIWGGTGWVGVDCSGLVQSALASVGMDAPRDADQQEKVLGQAVDFGDRRVGDLLFWAGHVGIVARDDQLLHANAHHMRTALEPIETAVARIGPVRTVKRLNNL